MNIDLVSVAIAVFCSSLIGFTVGWMFGDDYKDRKWSKNADFPNRRVFYRGDFYKVFYDKDVIITTTSQKSNVAIPAKDMKTWHNPNIPPLTQREIEKKYD